jgi:hypothetical protein
MQKDTGLSSILFKKNEMIALDNKLLDSFSSMAM